MRTWIGVGLLLGTSMLIAGCPSLEVGTLPDVDNVSGTHWLRFVQISDTQLTDEESPARSIRTDPLISASWRPQEAYGVATLDATVRAINARHNADGPNARPIDFVVVTGDLSDSGAYNELRWFIDTMDGAVVETDSGVIDGLTRANTPKANPKLPINTIGLDPSIPWYSVIGNHDILATGNFPIDTRSNSPVLYTAPLLGPVAAVIGLHDIAWNLNAFVPVAGQSPAVLTGEGPRTDPDNLQLRVGALRAGRIPPDTERRFLTRRDFMAEHFNTTSQPVGHGFSEENLAQDTAFYTFRPDPAVPVRFIALDTVPPKIPRGFPAFYGVMTHEQFEDQLKPAIAAARAAGEFVILLSHHPSDDFDLPFPARKVGAREYRDYLAAQPNVIAHLCGHTHINQVKTVPGRYPYFEVETGAVIDAPQEGRVFDLRYDELTGVVTLATEHFSHRETPNTLSEESYRRAVIDATAGQGYPPGDAKASDAAYQAIFAEAAPAWGMETIPREETRHALEQRKGTELDRDVVIRLPRPQPDSWASLP